MPRTRNRRTGKIDPNTPDHIIEHPVLGKDLEIVGDNDKPLVPELIPQRRTAEIAAASKQRPEKKDS